MIHYLFFPYHHSFIVTNNFLYNELYFLKQLFLEDENPLGSQRRQIVSKFLPNNYNTDQIINLYLSHECSSIKILQQQK